MVEGNHGTWSQQCEYTSFQGLDVGTCVVVGGGCKHIGGGEGWGQEHRLGLSADTRMLWRSVV